jgi:hypothetical protein
MLRGSFERLVGSHRTRHRRNKGSGWTCSELNTNHARVKEVANERSSQAKVESERSKKVWGKVYEHGP